MAGHQVIHFEYGMSPYAQKTRALLTLANIPYTSCPQPVVLPRPDLEALGITYRRIPLLAVGRDVYCDSALIISVVLSQLARKRVATSPADRAWEAWGYATFVAVLALAPAGIVDDEKFVKDRETIFPALRRPDFKTLRPSGLAELRARLAFLEDEVLSAERPFVAGETLGLADLHVVFGIRWALFDLGVQGEQGVGREAFPRVWRVIDAVPQGTGKEVGGQEAVEMVKGAALSAEGLGFVEGDPTGLTKGAQVTVESSDAAPGAHPQAGKLVGLAVNEMVLELDSGVHLHFPREGYILRKA